MAGLPLAESLTRNFDVLGSVRKSTELDRLEKENINSFLIDLAECDLENTADFFNTETLIITIPPSAETYVQNIKKVIVAVEKSNIKNVIYCSSISVYGNQTGIITEKKTTYPISENAKKIVEVEQLLLENTHFKTTILRLGGLIGKNRHPAKYLSNKIVKNPENSINLIHLIDCIGSIETIITQNLIGIYNIVAPHHPSKIEYYSTICKELKIAPPVHEKIASTNNKTISSQKIKEYYQFINSTLSI